MALGSPRLLFVLDQAAAEQLPPYPENVLLAPKDGEDGDAEGGKAQIRNDGRPVYDRDAGQGQPDEDVEPEKDDPDGELDVYSTARRRFCRRRIVVAIAVLPQENGDPEFKSDGYYTAQSAEDPEEGHPMKSE